MLRAHLTGGADRETVSVYRAVDKHSVEQAMRLSKHQTAFVTASTSVTTIFFEEFQVLRVTKIEWDNKVPFVE